MPIHIVDYKMGNLGSIVNILKKIGVKATISSSPADILSAEKLILPGVGSFDNGMKNIRDLGLEEALRRRVLEDKVPALGICLGMQLLTRKSEEGVLTGLGWIAADTVRFQLIDPKLRVPHMGWNNTQPADSNSLFAEMPTENPRFYFVHSFYVKCDSISNVLAWTEHEIKFASSIRNGSIFGVQFHPEKSHKFGMKLLSNFSKFKHE